MPRVCEFYGISIYFYFDEHPQPHFHAIYAEFAAQIRISDLAVTEGNLPARALGLVVEWASARKAELEEDWNLAAQGQQPKKIAPLK